MIRFTQLYKRNQYQRLDRNCFAVIVCLFLLLAPAARPAAAYTAEESPLELFRMADYYMVNAQNDKAREILEKLITIAPDNPEYHKQLAVVYQQLDQYSQALSEWKTTLFLDPRDPDANFNLGKLYLALKQPERSLYYLERAELLLEDPIEISYYLGNAYYLNNRYDSAAAQFTLFLEYYESNESVLYNLASCYFYLKDYDAAEKYFNLLLKESPENFKCLLRLAQVYAVSRQEDKLKDIYQRILNSDVNARLKAEVIKSVGIYYFNSNELAEAVQVFKDLLVMYPKKIELLFLLAKLYFEEGQLDQALAYSDRAIALNPRYIGPYLIAANVYEKKMAYTKAIDMYRSIIQLYPDNQTIKLMLGVTYYKNRVYAEAEKLFREGISARPDFEWNYYYLGLVYQKLNQPDTVLALFKQVLEVNPQTENSTALNYVGYSLAEQGIDLDRAEQYIHRALEIEPDNYFYIDSLAWVYYQKKQFKKAYSIISRLRTFSVEDPVIFEHFGDIALKLEKKDEAIDFYKKSLAIEADKKIKEKLDAILYK